MKPYLNAWLVLLVLFANACQQKAPTKRSQEWLESLEKALVKAKDKSDYRNQLVKREVKKSGNTSEGLKSLQRITVLRKRTAKVLYEIEKKSVKEFPPLNPTSQVSTEEHCKTR